MKILGIETSCDETSVSVVENGRVILSNIIASSADMHAATGGIIPEQAARQQVVSILPVLSNALNSAGVTKEDIDAIAVTSGPGLIGSLLVGIETARTLSSLWDKPLISVNHLVAHLYANWLMDEEPKFPALALVISGGHTDLVLMKNHGDIEWIGGTRDDAAGEAFDKAARLLGLPYPGGPAIGKEAQVYIDNNPNDKLEYFPRPMKGDKNFDWSFSGLKTAVLRETQKEKPLSTGQISAEVQEAIIDVLLDKTFKAVDLYHPKSLLLAGGVSANARLAQSFRSKSEKYPDLTFFIPPPRLCTDNAAYIAACGYFVDNKISKDKIIAIPDLSIIGQV
jgi:N6-L-threonylcarbamoyladenine synthase